MLHCVCFKTYKLCASLFAGSSKDPCGDGEVEALRIRNAALLRDLEEVMESRDEKAKENALMAAKLEQTEKELKHAKEALVGKSQIPLSQNFTCFLCNIIALTPVFTSINLTRFPSVTRMFNAKLVFTMPEFGNDFIFQLTKTTSHSQF